LPRADEARSSSHPKSTGCGGSIEVKAVQSSSRRLRCHLAAVGCGSWLPHQVARARIFGNCRRESEEDRRRWSSPRVRLFAWAASHGDEAGLTDAPPRRTAAPTMPYKGQRGRRQRILSGAIAGELEPNVEEHEASVTTLTRYRSVTPTQPARPATDRRSNPVLLVAAKRPSRKPITRLSDPAKRRLGTSTPCCRAYDGAPRESRPRGRRIQLRICLR